MDEDSSMEQKTWQVNSFGNRNVFKLHSKESREGFFLRGQGRSFHVDGLKTEKVQEPKSGESGTMNLMAESIRSSVFYTEQQVHHKHCIILLLLGPKAIHQITSKSMTGCSSNVSLSLYLMEETGGKR